MQYIDPSNKLLNWVHQNGYYVPTSVPTTCAFCGQPTAINLRLNQIDVSSNIPNLNLNGECVRCGEKFKAWIIEPKKFGQAPLPEDSKCKEIWVLPKASNIREFIISSEDDKFPPRLFNIYKEAVNCFNAGFWRASVNECGQTLEGILKDKFPNEEEKETLNKVLQNVEKDLETNKDFGLFIPIIKVGYALRLGRNKSAYIDPAIDPDKETAEKLLDLIEYLIEYFYIVSDKAKNLEEKMKNLEG